MTINGEEKVTDQQDQGKEQAAVQDKKETGPSDPHDAYMNFLAKQAEKAKAAKAEPGPSEGKGEKGQEDRPDEKKVHKHPWENLRIVDKDGNEVPFPISVDGEKVDLKDLNKLGTYAQFGAHHDKTGADLKKEKEDLQSKIQQFENEVANFKKGRPFLEQLQRAIEEGRIQIGGAPASKKKTEEEELAEIGINVDEISDPDMLKLAKVVREQRKKIEEYDNQIAMLKQIQLGIFMREEKSKLDKEIADLKPKYPLADHEEIINFLAELDEHDKPRYTVEEALKKSQEKEKVRFDAYIKQDPEFFQKSEEEKQKIKQEYIDDLNKRNAPPAQSPSVVAAAKAGGKEDRSKWKPEQWFQAGSEMLAQRLAQAKKS